MANLSTGYRCLLEGLTNGVEVSHADGCGSILGFFYCSSPCFGRVRRQDPLC